jgi:hypothetical protein
LLKLVGKTGLSVKARSDSRHIHQHALRLVCRFQANAKTVALASQGELFQCLAVLPGLRRFDDKMIAGANQRSGFRDGHPFAHTALPGQFIAVPYEFASLCRLGQQ